MPGGKKTSKKQNDIASQNGIQNAPPNWPDFNPKPFNQDLCLISVVQDQIVTIPEFWTPRLCQKYINFLSSLPLVTTPGKPKRGEAVRVNDRFQIHDPGFAKKLWEETGLRNLVISTKFDGEEQARDPQAVRERQRALWGGEPIGLNPNIRVYRYSKGQFFDQHCKLYM